LTPNADPRPSRVHRRRAKNDIGVTNAIESDPPAASGDTDRKHVDPGYPGYRGSILVPMKSKTRPLEGQVAVVAGATRGAGRGIARMLGEAGAVVYLSIISARPRRTGATARRRRAARQKSSRAEIQRSSLPTSHSSLLALQP